MAIFARLRVVFFSCGLALVGGAASSTAAADVFGASGSDTNE